MREPVAAMRATTEKLKRAVSPAEFYRIELGVNLNRDGWQVAGRCPFHLDHHAGSFKIHAGTGAYKCFSCGAGGNDIIDFVERRYDLSFREAVRQLASAWAVRL